MDLAHQGQVFLRGGQLGLAAQHLVVRGLHAGGEVAAERLAHGLRRFQPAAGHLLAQAALLRIVELLDEGVGRRVAAGDTGLLAVKSSIHHFYLRVRIGPRGADGGGGRIDIGLRGLHALVGGLGQREQIRQVETVGGGHRGR
ncbi:hypothetical protein D3C72_1431280 [compost metagenome]